MKKFLVFLVSIVVVVCLGLTTFYFLRNDEIISIKTKEIYCNAGDVISLDSLGINRVRPYHSTTFDYNAGGEAVTSQISFDKEANCYIVSNDAQGDITLVIGTSNDKYSKFEINVHVGNGSEANPYFVFSEVELNKIGKVYGLDAHYILMNDVTLTSEFSPIGYNSEANSWNGFSGSFNGNNHTINGLNLSGDYNNAGLFYSINAGASVHDLTITNATINGSYAYAGALAGTIAGSVERVAVENVTITNTANAGITGAFAGAYNGTLLQLSYVENADINVSSAESNVVGGFIGKIDIATAKATYANNVTISSGSSATAIGGYVGEFVITTESGSIQQSYANATFNEGAVNCGAFIGRIVESGEGFDSVSTMIRHLIGNVAIDANDTEIVDTDMVASYNDKYFVLTNEDYANRNVFYNNEASLYMVRGYASVAEAINAENPFVFFAIDQNNITSWDTEYVWKLSSSRLPTLTMGGTNPSNPSSEYMNRNLNNTDANKDTFINVFASDINGSNITFSDAGVYELSNHTPINITNSTIDGNGATIRVNLANARDGFLGLFAKVDNSTIKNLNIIVTGVSANANQAGGLAGQIVSSDEMSSSLVENVTVTFESNISATELAVFGGIAGSVDRTNLQNVAVNGLNVTNLTYTSFVGGAVGHLVNSTINNVTVNANICAVKSANVGGITGDNYGTIANAKGNISIKVIAENTADIGGIASVNSGTIIDSAISVEIVLEDAQNSVNIGGVTATNSGTIANTRIYGNGISVAKEINSTVNIGGIAVTNNMNISNTYNLMNSIGTYHVGKNYNVAGIVVNNQYGTISQVVAGSNIYGNTVAGVVVSMKTTNDSKIDQVLVANYNPETKAIQENHIKGDKYVTGIAYELSYGTISNVQAKSRIEGGLNETRSSLIVLIFPSSAKLANATIDSAIVGAGTKYRESWTDYASVVENKNSDTRYNIYDDESSAGIMTSVVINTSREGVADTKRAMGIVNRYVVVITWGNTYNGNSFVKYTDDASFVNSATFSGSFTFECAYNNLSEYIGLYDAYHTETKTLTFDIGSTWTATNGIVLSFVA